MTVLHALGLLHRLARHLRRGRVQPPADGNPSRGCAWNGPWPVGSLPVCVSYGDGAPIFVGYVAVTAGGPPRDAELAQFWRGHAAAFDRQGVQD